MWNPSFSFFKDGIGLDAINDSFLLEGSIYRLLRRHCRDQPYYIHLLELFTEVPSVSIDFTGTHTTTSKVLKAFLFLCFCFCVRHLFKRSSARPWTSWLPPLDKLTSTGSAWRGMEMFHWKAHELMETSGCNYLCFSGTRQLWNTRRLITLSTFQWPLQCTL